MSVTTYTKVKVKVSAPVKYEADDQGKLHVVKELPFTTKGKVIPYNLKSYKPRKEQFCDGTSKRQNEILDMMINPGLVKGLKNYDGIRYLVDGFKSFVEGSYKYQFGELCSTLDYSNKFVRAILNEPFIEDLEKSTNPLFKDTPNGTLDLKYLLTGGNKNYSTLFLNKFTKGAEFCFFYGSGILKSDKLTVPAGKVSNLFISKSVPFDVVANITGYIDGVDGIEINPDEDDRGYMEKFKWNPIVKLNNGFTIYGNLTGKKDNTSMSQITTSELLAYIKESLYNLAKSESFKKGIYNEYLALEVEVTTFMDNLALAGAIEPNPIVQCNATNNTKDVSKQKIKLVHIEFTPINALDKVVFDLQIN